MIWHRYAHIMGIIDLTVNQHNISNFIHDRNVKLWVLKCKTIMIPGGLRGTSSEYCSR